MVDSYQDNFFMSIFSKLYKKNTDHLKKENEIDQFNALCILYEAARIDGQVDESEIQIIKNYFDNNDENNFEDVLKKIETDARSETSLYPYIKEINNKMMKKQKIHLLKIIWKLINSDGKVDSVEEEIFYKVGNLLNIKRTEIQKIKIKAF